MVRRAVGVGCVLAVLLACAGVGPNDEVGTPEPPRPERPGASEKEPPQKVPPEPSEEEVELLEAVAAVQIAAPRGPRRVEDEASVRKLAEALVGSGPYDAKLPRCRAELSMVFEDGDGETVADVRFCRASGPGVASFPELGIRGVPGPAAVRLRKAARETR